MGPITPVGRFNLDLVVLVDAYIPRRIVQSLSTICGVWTAIAPLLLWIAWPPKIWMALFWSGMIAMLLTGIFTAALMPPTQKTPRRSSAADIKRLPPK
ncbi:MAG: hypothetical protein R3D67_02990 [Hyphomicrobiaceae bacterium]